MRSRYFRGIAVGSVITIVLLYLPFSGLLGRFFLPGLLGILFALSLAIPGALVAGLSAHGGRQGALAGAVTGLLGYLVLVLTVAQLRGGPLFPIEFVLLNGLFLTLVALTVGGIVGYLRRP